VPYTYLKLMAMSKYDRFGVYLSAQGGRCHNMTFGQMERVLGFSLPASARKHGGWWTNLADGSHSQALAWLGAGWRVWRADLVGERVEFERIDADLAAGVAEDASAPFRRDAPAVKMTDPVTFDRDRLNIAARRILDDYSLRFGGDVQWALDVALEEARIAYCQRLIESTPRGPPSPVSSVDLIREDRDAR